MTTRTNKTDIDIMVSAFVDGLTTRQQAYQNAVLNGKDTTSAKQDLKQLINVVDCYLEMIHVPFSKNDPLEPLRRAKGQALYVLINI
jgi:hypothetical protein